MQFIWLLMYTVVHYNTRSGKSLQSSDSKLDFIKNVLYPCPWSAQRDLLGCHKT